MVVSSATNFGFGEYQIASEGLAEFIVVYFLEKLYEYRDCRFG